MTPLIGIAGYARTGKTTIAEWFRDQHGYEIMGFADPLKEQALELDPLVVPGTSWSLREIVANHGWEVAKDKYPEVRGFLVALGQSTKKIHGPHVWADAWSRRLISTIEPIIAPDMRFITEYRAVIEHSGTTIYVERPGVGPANETEKATTQLRDICHHVIVNDGTVADLYKKLEAIV